jgi:hypothetical protein
MKQRTMQRNLVAQSQEPKARVAMPGAQSPEPAGSREPRGNARASGLMAHGRLWA